jgi:hypothetical protein
LDGLVNPAHVIREGAGEPAGCACAAVSEYLEISADGADCAFLTWKFSQEFVEGGERPYNTGMWRTEKQCRVRSKTGDSSLHGVHGEERPSSGTDR